MNQEKTEKEFEFLDDKCKGQVFYKVLKQNPSNPDIYNNMGFKKVIDYELYTWYTEEDAPLDRSTVGVGFYSYKSLKNVIKNSYYNVGEFVTGKCTIHPVNVKEVCAIGNDAVRSRMIRILEPYTFDEIIEELTEWDETPEKILEKYIHYTSELDRFTAVKSLLDEKAKEKERKNLMELCKPKIKEYWVKYNKYKPFFERLEITRELFQLLEIPSDYEGSRISFHNYDDEYEYNRALESLDVALSFLKDIVEKQARSIQLFIPRVKKRLAGIEEKALKDKDHIDGLLETHKDLLSDIPELGENDGTYTLHVASELRKIGRKRYNFQLSHVSAGREAEVDIFELE